MILIIISDIVFSIIIIFHQNNLTALLLAAQFGTAETVKLLLEAGALIEAKNTVSKRISI